MLLPLQMYFAGPSGVVLKIRVGGLVFKQLSQDPVSHIQNISFLYWRTDIAEPRYIFGIRRMHFPFDSHTKIILIYD